MSVAPRFAVIGAGAVGLATAVQLQTEFPNASVTIITKDYLAGTTSIGAAGIFRPTPAKTPGVPYDTLMPWLKETWDYFTALAHSENAGDAGCQLISGYEFYNSEPDLNLMKNTLYSLDKVNEKELNIYPGPKYNVGYRSVSILTSPVRFLPFLMSKFKANGGKMEYRTLTSMSELVSRYDVVMNCTALGSRELVGDSLIYPSRGHLIRVKAPWIKTSLYAEDGKGGVCHLYPTPDFVVVGGIKQTGNEDLTPRDVDTNAIWDRACTLVPSLRKAQILGEWVGLRPMRKPLRLESEVMQFDNGALNVVHNYGHGGEGISLSWGTAAHAVRLAKEIVQKAQIISKL